MHFEKFWGGMTRAERIDYCERASLSSHYVRVWLYAPIERRQCPRPSLYMRMLAASGGKLTRNDMFSYFTEEIGNYRNARDLEAAQRKAGRAAIRTAQRKARLAKAKAALNGGSGGCR